MFDNSAICLSKLFLMEFCKQCEAMTCWRSGKPAEKLKLASNSNNTNDCVWIFHGPLMVIEKVHHYYHLTKQFDAKSKFTFFKQHLDLKQHGHNSILPNGDGRRRMSCFP